MRFCSIVSRALKTNIRTVHGIFSLFAIVLVLPMSIEARDYHIRASDGEVYTVTLGEEPGVKNFSVQNSNGEMLRGVTETERATAAELYFPARLFAEVLPIYSPETPSEDIEEWVTDIAKGAIIKLLTKQGLDILTNGLVNGFTGAVQLILGGDVVSIAQGWIPGAAADAIGDELENRLLVDAAVITKGAARKAMEQEQILRAFWLAYETRSIVISMEGVNAAWASFHKWVAYHSLTTNLVNRYLRDPESEVSLGTGSLDNIAASLLPAAGGIVTTLSTIDTIIGGIEAVESHAYTLEHLQRLQDINETAVSEIQQYASSRIDEGKNQSRADLDQASFFQPMMTAQLDDVQILKDDSPQRLDVRDYFSPSGTDNLTYRGRSSDLRVAVAQVERSGSSVIIITPKEVGTTSVTVELITLRGLSVSQSFIVRVADRAQQNQPPEAVGTISEQSLTVPGPARPVDMASYFSSENDLIYDAESDSSDIVTESVSGSQVTLTPIQEGSATVTVTARDSENPALSATQTIAVVVRPNSATIVRPPAPDEDTYVPVEDATIVRPTSVPDLIVQSIEADKTTLNPGESFQIDTRLWNQGRTTSSSTTLRYYLSTDETISSEEDTEVASERVDALSGRGATASRRRSDVSRTLIAPDTPGIHYYGVCIDAVSNEVKTTNNYSEAIEITVEAPPSDPAESQTLDPVDIQGPDLIISAARVDASTILLGGGVRLHITLTNQGTDRAPATTIRYYRSSDATIPAEDTELRAVPVGVLGAGKSYTTWALLPGATSLGVYYYGACLDGVASEFDTSNNCSETFEISIVSRGGGKPTLIPSGIISTQELDVGDTPRVLDVSSNFIGKVKNWRANSSHTNVVTVSMSGSDVTLTPVSKGWSLVTILASSGDLEARQIFYVSVGGVAVPEFEVFMPDTNLRAAVRSTLGLAKDDTLTRQRILRLTTLSASEASIRNLKGLEYATLLTNLSLGTNQIQDLTPLQHLRSLTELILWKNEKIVDLTPLQNLTNLRRLALDINEIRDLTPLESLSSLADLSLGGNRVINVYPLRNLRNLTDLWLVGNQISDVTSLEGLTSLKKLWLRGNPIEDLAPLRRLKQDNPSVFIDIDIGGGAPSAPVLPDETELLSNYPNPFNPETWIPYQLAKAADVTLTIYDVRGVVVRELMLGHQAPGFYYSRGRAAHWDGRNEIGEKVATGLYFCTFTAGEFTATQKMLIRK